MTQQIDIQFPKPVVAGSIPVARSDFSICHTPAHIYHSWAETSCSQLKALRESPVAFYWRHIAREAPPRKSESLDYGTLLHTWAELGEEDFWPRVAAAPDSLVTATGALSKKADDWLKGLDPTRIPISPADRDKLRAQTTALLANPEVQRLLAARTDAEFNVRWKWNGHDVRCRVDGATPDCFFDWKTTRDSNPMRTWWRSVLDFGYHLQSAMYQSAQEAIGMPPSRMRFIVTSTVWPYENCVVVLPEPMVERGRLECLRLLEELRNRLDWGVWERFGSQEVCELTCPEWALKGE